MGKINLYICLPACADSKRIGEIIGKYQTDDEKSMFDEEGMVWCVVTDCHHVGVILDEIDRDIRLFTGDTRMNYVFAYNGWLHTDIEDKETLESLVGRYARDNDGMDCGVRQWSVMEVLRAYSWGWKIPLTGDAFVLRIKSLAGSDDICRTVSCVKLKESMEVRYDSDAARIYWTNEMTPCYGFAEMVSLSFYMLGYAYGCDDEVTMDFWHVDCMNRKLYTGCDDARENDHVVLKYAQEGMHYSVASAGMSDIAKKALGL